MFVPRTDLNDQRSDKNKLVVSAAVEAKMPFAAAAAMAWPEYKAGQTMTLSEWLQRVATILLCLLASGCA